MKEITLYGAGGHCYAVVELIRSLGEYELVRILDDATDVSEILGVPVVASEDKLIKDHLCVAIGDNSVRKRIASENTGNYPVFVHNSVVKYPSVEIKEGTVVLPNVVIDAAAEIGKHCILNNNATISHNATIGDFCHIAIQAAQCNYWRFLPYCNTSCNCGQCCYWRRCFGWCWKYCSSQSFNWEMGNHWSWSSSSQRCSRLCHNYGQSR